MNHRPIDLPVRTAKPRGVRALINHLPTAVIAVVLAVSALAAAHDFPWARALVPFTPFVPGAVQRTNWRHLLAALACAVLAMAVHAGLRFVSFDHLYVLSYIVYPATAMLLVGAMEWLLRGRAGKEQLAAVLAACLAAAALFAIVQTALACTEKTVALPGPGGWVARYTAAEIIYFPLEGALLWMAIPMGLTASPRRRSVVLGASAAALVLYVACSTVIIFDVARESLVGHGPFGRSAAAGVLAQRGSDADFATIWEAVRSADWEQSHEWFEGTDYRLQCIGLLTRHDPADTASRLASLLESENKQTLADAAAPLVATYRLYDAVPVLLRFACMNDQTCVSALERLRIPQVAFARLLWAALDESSQRKKKAIQNGELPQDTPISSLKVSDSLRQDLIPLLGDCKCDTIGDWERYYNRVIHKRPTPLSKELGEQCDRVVRALNEWWFLQAKWAEIKQHRIYSLAIAKMKKAGLEKQADLIESSAQADVSKQQVKLPKEKSPLFEALVAMDGFIDQSRAEIVDPRINLEANGVDGLEDAIGDYKDWVDKEFAIEFPHVGKGMPPSSDKAPEQDKTPEQDNSPAQDKKPAQDQPPAPGKPLQRSAPSK